MAQIQEILYRIHQGSSQRQIERSLGISRRAIARILKKAQKVGFRVDIPLEKVEEIGNTLIPSQTKETHQGEAYAFLKDHHDQIHAWRQMSHMTTTQMVRLFSEQGKKVSETTLRRYIKGAFPVPIRTTVYLESTPGQQAQVDFAYVGKMKDACGNLRKAYVFIMVLSHSRYRFVRFVFKQDIETWVDCHIRAFHFFGGVPRTIVLDNLKAGVTLPDFYDPVANKTYAELERHYGFIVDPAKVRTPQHKGKVERSVTIVRQQVLAGRTFDTIEESNQRALQWCRHEISMVETATTGRKPYDHYREEEKNLLKSLPPEDYECPEWQSCKVHRDQHIVFQGSFYSVPHHHVGQVVWGRATRKLLNIFYDNKCIKKHVRTAEKGQWVTDTKDYLDCKNMFLEKDSSYCLQKAKEVGENTHLLMGCILDGSLTSRRKAQAILRLSEHYGERRLEAACKRSLAFENLSYKGIKGILEKNLDGQSLGESLKRGLLKAGSYLRPAKAFSQGGYDVRRSA